MGVPLYITSPFYLGALKFFFSLLPLPFDSFNVCPNVALFGFNLFGILWASWIWMSIFLLRFGNF